ncbi:hypothetical protein LINGRAHAP2_LOCUS31998 [Linum grandiflorum]
MDFSTCLSRCAFSAEKNRTPPCQVSVVLRRKKLDGKRVLAPKNDPILLPNKDDDGSKRESSDRLPHRFRSNPSKITTIAKTPLIVKSIRMKKRKTDGNRVNILSTTRALRLPALNPNNVNATVNEAGLGCSKRIVRFQDTENDEILDASPIRSQRKQASRWFQEFTSRLQIAAADEPSTSEFASFKKLKEDAGQRLRCPTLHHEPKNSRTSSLAQNRSSEFVLQDKSGNSSNSHDYMLLHETAPPDNSGALRTPAPHGLCKESVENDQLFTLLSGFDKPDNGMTMRNISSPRKIRATLEPYDTVLASESPGVVRPGELFHRKRQRLRQWVTEVSYPELNNDISSNRYDTVSMMLKRLFPVRDPKLTSGKVKSHDSMEHEIGSRKGLTSAEWNLAAEYEYGRPSDVSLASCWLGIPSHREPSNINFSTCRSPVAYFDYEIREPNYGNEGRAYPNTRGRSVYASSSRQLKEWDAACFPTECSSARPPHPLLLGWDLDKKNEERWGAWQNREIEECSTTLSLWGDDRRRKAPAMLSYSHLSELPHSGSFSGKDYKIAILEDTPRLPLENEDINALYSDSPQDQCWHLSNIVNEDGYAADIEIGSNSWFDFNSRQKCLPWNGFSKPLALEFHQRQGSPEQLLSGDVFEDSHDVIHHQDTFNHLREETYNVDGRGSCYSHDKGTALPLLLDKSHWDVGDEDRYY